MLHAMRQLIPGAALVDSPAKPPLTPATNRNLDEEASSAGRHSFIQDRLYPTCLDRDSRANSAASKRLPQPRHNQSRQP